MNTELKLVSYIKQHGLEKTLQDFRLKSRDYPHKVLIKYDQIESPMGAEEVQEARGIVLEKDTWKVMCYPLKKFFNHGEGHGCDIDWNTAKVFEKCDGTFIAVYFDWVLDKWCVSTTGMAEGEGEVGDITGLTFAKLFIDTFKSVTGKDMIFFDMWGRNYVFMFELMTPYNIVVTPHSTSNIKLLAVRDLGTLREMNFEDVKYFAENIGVEMPIIYDLNKGNFGALIKTFEGMPYTNEGYVVLDANNNRRKCKNPAYVAVHHIKGKTANHNIMAVVKSNEIDEFAATFPDRKEEIFKLKANYDALVKKLLDIWDELTPHKPKNITKEEQKKFAMKVFEISKKHEMMKFTGLFFCLKDGKIESVKDYMFNYDDKDLYHLLNG